MHKSKSEKNKQKKSEDNYESKDFKQQLGSNKEEMQKHRPSKRPNEESIPIKFEKDQKIAKKMKLESEERNLKSRDLEHAIKKESKKRKRTESELNSISENPNKKSKLDMNKKNGNGKNGDKKEDEVWEWWKEEKLDDGHKWKTLSHKGPVFPPPYEPLPNNIKFRYAGKHCPLSPEAEEVCGFYARMLDHEYVTKEVFNDNFFKDWKRVMTPKEKELIQDLSKCDFKQINEYYKSKSEEKKSSSKEAKKKIKMEADELVEEYGFCYIDGHKQKIGNFRIEPPGLFRGRGEHPKMGKLKRRVNPKDITINIGKEATIPKAPEGHSWGEVRHDNTVSWLVSWTENVLGQTKYIMLNPSSKLKGEKDFQKYEIARKLKKRISKIREDYMKDWKSKEMRIRQRSVALYFIDKLALRAGNEKEEGETADTVGCCSLRVEHITLHKEKDDKEYVVDFDFLGKDSIRYENSISVEKQVFKNLVLFQENKKPDDDLFDRLNTSVLNKHLTELMEGLTAKVFRTYNASKTLQEQLDLLTQEKMSVSEKILSYNRANRSVAILCNHQRSVPKTFSKQMETLQNKIKEKKDQVKQFKKDLKGISKNDRALHEKKSSRYQLLKEQLEKLNLQATDKDENKQIALGTSKLNYLDPRISVAWCKKWDVPIEKIYNKAQQDKFRWAIEMSTPDYVF